MCVGSLRGTVFYWYKTRILSVRTGTFVFQYTIMSRQIKLIWDFRGPAATKTAQHHEIHLREFIHARQLPLDITGVEILNDMYAIAYMVVTDAEMITVRDLLKPHRGEVYEP